jgi:hypothetical protein
MLKLQRKGVIIVQQVGETLIIHYKNHVNDKP